MVPGYLTSLLSPLGNTLINPGSAVIGPGGDLYFTEVVGSGCSPASATQVYRLPMSGRIATVPGTIVPFTASSMMAHEMVYDSVTDALYAAGTCSQTTSIYRISNTGVIFNLNPNFPLNDPDGIAVGTPAFSTNPHAFIAAQDGLFAINLITLVMHQITVDLTATSATTLGNWGFLTWDPNTRTLLGGLTGRPVVRACVEIQFTSATTAVATEIAPDGTKPMCVDHLGIRYFSSLDQFGILNPTVGTMHAFRATMGGFPSTGRLAADTDGSFLLLDHGSKNLYRATRPFVSDAYVVSTSVGQHVHLSVDAPMGRAFEPYLILASYTGSTPGTTYGPLIVPLNRDLITEVGYAMAQLGDLMTDQWLGTLDATGHANARFRFPAGIVPSGVTFNLAFILGLPEFTSNSLWIHVIP
jgi:hypothetical protein